MSTRRRLRYRLLLVGLTCSACTRGESDAARVPAASVDQSLGWNTARVDTLHRFGREDQDGRGEAVDRAIAARDTAMLFGALRADSARTRWLRAAVARHGWPSRTIAGDSAQQAAWNILQHSPDTAWQAAMLPELERLASNGELTQADVALLTDRIFVHRGQPQRYGSQFYEMDGRWMPEAIEDIAALDVRRASVGLQPMAAYARLLGEQTKLPVVWPPGR